MNYILTIDYQIISLLYTILLTYICYIIHEEHDKLTELEDNSDTDSDYEEDVLPPKIVNYEDKYLDKYAIFSAEFMYSEEELLIEKNKHEELLKKYRDVENSNLEDIQKEAREYMHNLYLNKLKNSYIMEHTPLGNVAMCYNNEKGSFDYYSDKIIPYRYLETVARKYVIFFHCKKLYIDMNDELKQYEIKLQKEQEERQSNAKNNLVQPNDENNQKKDLFVKLKNYNKDTSRIPTRIPSRLNTKKPELLQNSIKPNMVSSDKQKSENILLKENANRYTHTGKFLNFMILKKINKTHVDKNYSMSYKDYKMMQR